MIDHTKMPLLYRSTNANPSGRILFTRRHGIQANILMSHRGLNPSPRGQGLRIRHRSCVQFTDTPITDVKARDTPRRPWRSLGRGSNLASMPDAVRRGTVIMHDYHVTNLVAGESCYDGETPSKEEREGEGDGKRGCNQMTEGSRRATSDSSNATFKAASAVQPMQLHGHPLQQVHAYKVKLVD